MVRTVFRRLTTLLSILWWVPLATPATAAEPRQRTVCVDLTGISDAAFERVDGVALEKAAIVRLVQDGFAVSGKAMGPDVTVELSDADGWLVLTASSETQRLQERVAVSEEAAVELQLEIAQKISDLVRSLALPAPPPVSPEVSVALPPEGAEPGLALRLEAGGGLVWREGGSDPAVRLGVSGQFGLPFSVVLSGSRLFAGGEGIRVSEYSVLLGAAIPITRFSSLELDAGLALGGSAHAFALESPATMRDGIRWDLLVEAPLELHWRPVAGFLASLRIAPRLTSRSREHALDSAPVWRRGAMGLEAGLAVGWQVD